MQQNLSTDWVAAHTAQYSHNYPEKHANQETPAMSAKVIALHCQNLVLDTA